jgi:uncharacterized protein (TIGR02147 family)
MVIFKNAMKNLFEYFDYRQFLRDFYEEKKKGNYFYSFRFMAEKVGIDHSLLVKVLLGKRHISSGSVRQFGRLCGFSASEEKYFETLVNFDKARSESQSKVYFEKLLSLKGHTSKKIEEHHYEYFKKWHYAALRSLLDFYEFRGEDFKRLGEQLNPRISESEAREAVALLEKLGFIARNQNGVYRVCEAHVSTGEKWHSLAIKNYQKEIISHSLYSLERDSRETRDISTITMSITEDGFKEITELVKEFRAAVIKRVDEMNLDNRDRVYQLNMQLIPLSHVDTRHGRGGIK